MSARSLLRAHLVALGYRAWEHGRAVEGPGWVVRLAPEGPAVDGPDPLRWAVAAWWDGLSDEGRRAATEAGAR